MRLLIGNLWIELAPDMLDEALFAAARSAESSFQREFLEEREAIGSIEIVDIREQSFRDLDTRWAERLRLGDPLLAALKDCGLLAEGLSGCAVERARVEKEEGAELTVGDAGDRVLRITMKAETLLSRRRLEELVRAAL